MSPSPDVRPGAVPPERAEGPARSAPTLVRPLDDGPMLVEGPVDVVMPDGSVRHCERPMVALCTCRRSKRAPFCDTSHRHRQRRPRPAADSPEDPTP